MEWIFWVVIAFAGLLLIAHLFGGESESTQKKPSSSKSSGLKVSDYVPKQKNDDGIYCSPEIAHECIRIFSEHLGAHDEALSLYTSEFNKLISETEESLKQHQKNNDKEFKKHMMHFQKQFEDVSDIDFEDMLIYADFDDEDEDVRDEIIEIRKEISDARKSHKKIEKWIAAKELKLRQDCRKQLRVILTAANNAWKEDSHNFHWLEIDYELPDIPDRLY